MACDGLALAHLVPFRAHRHRAVACLFSAIPPSRLCRDGAAAVAADLLDASREYPPPAGRHRTAHRGQIAMVTETERRAWLRLARTENVGPVTFRNLVGRFGSASVALEE